MTLSSALNNAITGLAVNARAASLVSNNVANVSTEGYGRRELALSSRFLGGVQISGVERIIDQGILRDRRLADAALGYASDRSASLARMSDTIGTPDDPVSISGWLRGFESTLIEAGSRPDSDSRLDSAVSAAKSLTRALNVASDDVQAERLAAEKAISADVTLLNTSLGQVEQMNQQIVALNIAGEDVTALLDERQLIVDRISKIVPVREITRADGFISLYTEGGAILLDDFAKEVGFTPVGFITADMTLASGALSGLTLDGIPAATSGNYAPLGGGTLAAAFDIRDDTGPEVQARLDTVARDLIERFADPALDATLGPTDPGLFTDGGAAFDPLLEEGLAGRIEVNAIVDPDQGGVVWRLRDGLGAAAPGDVGNGALLYGYLDALDDSRAPSSTSLGTTSRSFYDLVADLTSYTARDLAASEDTESFAAARQESLKTLELQDGVDTDYELQKLLLIEEAYAANAQVISVVNDMLDQLQAI